MPSKPMRNDYTLQPKVPVSQWPQCPLCHQGKVKPQPKEDTVIMKELGLYAGLCTHCQQLMYIGTPAEFEARIARPRCHGK